MGRPGRSTGPRRPGPRQQVRTLAVSRAVVCGADLMDAMASPAPPGDLLSGPAPRAAKTRGSRHEWRGHQVTVAAESWRALGKAGTRLTLTLSSLAIEQTEVWTVGMAGVSQDTAHPVCTEGGGGRPGSARTPPTLRGSHVGAPGRGEPGGQPALVTSHSAGQAGPVPVCGVVMTVTALTSSSHCVF